MKEWDKTYGSTDYEVLSIVRQTSDGGYIMGGSAPSGISGSRGFWLVKVGAAGAVEWVQVYGGKGLVTMEQTTDGGYILGGSYYSSGKSGDNSDPETGYWVVKINAKGKVQWDQSGSLGVGGEIRDLILTSDGGYLLAGWGSLISDALTYHDYWIVKLSSKGKQQFFRTYGGNRMEILSSVLQTSDGGYLLGGGSDSGISGNKTTPQKVYCNRENCTFNFWVVKVDASGDMEWDRTYGAEDGDVGQRIYDMVSTQDGGYLLGGVSDSEANFDKSEPRKSGWNDYYDYWVVKINATGDIQWDRTIGGDRNDDLRALLATPDGGFLLGGWSDSNVSGDKTEPRLDAEAFPDGRVGGADYWVVKIDAMGAKLWDRTFGGAGRDLFASMDLTTDGGYILGGTSNSPISGDKTEGNIGGGGSRFGPGDYWIVKMTGETCVTPTPAIALTPSSNTYTGGVMNNMYLGFGPKSMTMTANGGTTYMWSPSTGLSSTNTAETVFTPTEPGVYTFTVTAMNGECSANASVTITVMDVRCGSKNNKVMLCHNGKVLCVEEGAIKAHLKNHPEDRLGECLGDEVLAFKAENARVQVYPNPFTSSTTIAFSLTKPQGYTVEVYDGKGILMESWNGATRNMGEQVMLSWAPKHGERGLYVVKIITKEGVLNRQIVRE
ncbi:hypothetical protein GCM10023183_08300 [Nibribacter koreensis]|uniref:PKD/Chitinase domain-containing protein n=2 Tax=Nibribacter koreensis TaxID=1084519 RepID=A0ABP8FAY8_9BACT